jgi:hypothetical protein
MNTESASLDLRMYRCILSIGVMVAGVLASSRRPPRGSPPTPPR